MKFTLLANDIYSKLSKLVYLVAVITSVFLLLLMYDFYLKKKLMPVEDSIRRMKILSSSIEQEVDFSAKEISFFAQDKNQITSKNSKSFRNIFNTLNQTSDFFYGVGYFWNPKFANYGEYFFKNKQGQLEIKTMDEIYEPHHTKYYLRPWFTAVFQEKKKIIFSPQISWIGDQDNYITYGFPIIKNGEILAVGVFDIPTQVFDNHLNNLRKLELHKNLFNVYYVSRPYLGIHRSNWYFDIENSKIALNDPNIISKLDYVYEQNKKNQIFGWSYYKGSIYKRVSLLEGGLIFIFEYNFKWIFILTILWILSTFVFLKFFLKVIKFFVIKKITFITSPISEISQQATKLIQNKFNHSFSVDDSNTILEINQLVTSLEHMRNNIQTLMIKERELERSQTELELAAKLQKKMIPESFFQSVKSSSQNFVSIAARFLPARTLSGDLYDVVVKEPYIYVFIGDSTGKDITAAFFSLLVLGQFRLLCQYSYNPSEILFELNNFLCKIDAEDVFISGICLQFDMESQYILLSNAGHENPILYDKKGNQFIPENREPDIILGVIEDSAYALQTVSPISSIQHIVLFTDGITEACSPQGEYLGREHLQSIIAAAIKNEDSAYQICQTILDVCKTFENPLALNSENRSDDRTIAVVSLFKDALNFESCHQTQL